MITAIISSILIGIVLIILFVDWAAAWYKENITDKVDEEMEDHIRKFEKP